MPDSHDQRFWRDRKERTCPGIAQRYAKDYDAYEITCPDNRAHDLDELLKNAPGRPDPAKRMDWKRSTLLIVDNFNDDSQERFLQEIRDNTGDATILITSRLQKAPSPLKGYCRVVEMPDHTSEELEEECFQIFRKNYEQNQDIKLQENEVSKVREIIRETGMNIYYTVLLAVSMRENGEIEDPDDIIHESEIFDQKDYGGNRRRKTPEEYITDLIIKDARRIEVNTWHVQVLHTLSLMPAYRFKEHYICRILGDSGRHKKIHHAIEDLFVRRWVLFNGDDIYVHPLIAQAITFTAEKIRSEITDCAGSPYKNLHAFYEKMLCNWMFEPSEEVLLMAVMWSLWREKGIDKYLDLLCRSALGQRFETLDDGIYITVTGKSVLTFYRFSFDGETREQIFETYFGYFNADRTAKVIEEGGEGNCITAFSREDFGLDLDVIEKRYSLHIKGISHRAFYENGNLVESLQLPEGLTSIGDWAFSFCKNLRGELKLPDSLTSIGDSAFYDCENLSGELKLPDSLTSIGDSAFYGCKNLSGELKLPEGLTSIGNLAFFDTSINNVIFSQEFVSIAKNAFPEGCTLHLKQGHTKLIKYALDNHYDFTFDLRK